MTNISKKVISYRIRYTEIRCKFPRRQRHKLGTTLITGSHSYNPSQ